MSYPVIIAISITYLAVLFITAYFTQNSKRLNFLFKDNSFIYAMSLVVYCTAWTFFGSVGRAASTGLGFLGVYLGPILLAPTWIFTLKKVIRISKYLRITSIADFVSSRYGKSTTFGILVSILGLIIVIPYISIQLKALEYAVSILHTGNTTLAHNSNVFTSPALWFAISFAIFAIIFGTSKMDPSEKHPGVVNVMALESLIKLFSFLIASLVIIYGVYNGIGDIFNQAYAKLEMSSITILQKDGLDYSTWLMVLLLSAFAFLFLPRQFHIAVVENNSVSHLKNASWITPLYLFLISLFVLPVAIAGKLMFGDSVEPDMYLLTLTMEYKWVGVLVLIGGLAAASGMIIISAISVSIMTSNNIFLPLLLKIEKQYKYFLSDLNTRLLQIRRVIIFLVLILSFGFYKGFSINYSIVSVGLISFAGIAQIAPAVILGLYWKNSTAKGALAGFCIGVLIWGYTLPIANLADLGILNPTIIENGPWGISWLNPTSLLGIKDFQPIVHGSMWSVLMNTITLIVVSLYTKRSALEVVQSDIFINPEKYYKSENPRKSIIVRQANFQEFKAVLISILGSKKLNWLLDGYFKSHGIQTEPEIADSELITYVEAHLAGAIGTSSANIVLNHLVEQQPVRASELISILDETYQVYEYSQLLQSKSDELLKTTEELKNANQQLQKIDQLKNEFISNVTHELRTPITSIRSLSAILQKYDVSDDEKKKFLSIINEESERISALVNQVLDLRKSEITNEIELDEVDLCSLIQTTIYGFDEMKGNRKIIMNCRELRIETDRKLLKQVLINLISNAIKFTSDENGIIEIDVDLNLYVEIQVKDNGIGISKEEQAFVFERFYQVKQENDTKTQGSGLGLAICKTHIENLGGKITMKSQLGQGTTFTIQLNTKIIK